MRMSFIAGIAVLCCSGSVVRAGLPEVEPCVVLLAADNGDGTFYIGTGFFVSADGLIATADHVAVNPDNGQPRKLWARAANKGNDYSIYLLKLLKRFGSGVDSGRDIAILRVAGKHAKPFPFLPVGKEPVLGTEVFIVGFPVVQYDVLKSPFARRGIVSSTKYEHFGVPSIILDIPMVDGYSGSPVVDPESSEVMGVVNATFTERKEADFTCANRLTSEDIQSAIRSEAAGGVAKAKSGENEKPSKALVEFLKVNATE